MARDYRAENLQRRYGITHEDYQNQMMAQDGRCAICRQEHIVPLHVDHNHLTGALRGLLCHSCNVGLGHFGDDRSRLASAIIYLGSPDSVHHPRPMAQPSK